MPLTWKALYFRNRIRSNPIKILDKLISYLINKGYSPVYMKDLYNIYTKEKNLLESINDG